MDITTCDGCGLDTPYDKWSSKTLCPDCRRKSMPNMNYEDTPDLINKPEHYHTGGLDAIGYLKLKYPPKMAEGFFLGNVIKYVTRYQSKGDALQDLKKAEYYLKKLIECYEKE